MRRRVLLEIDPQFVENRTEVLNDSNVVKNPHDFVYMGLDLRLCTWKHLVQKETALVKDDIVEGRGSQVWFRRNRWVRWKDGTVIYDLPHGLILTGFWRNTREYKGILCRGSPLPLGKHVLSKWLKVEYFAYATCVVFFEDFHSVYLDPKTTLPTSHYESMSKDNLV